MADDDINDLLKKGLSLLKSLENESGAFEHAELESWLKDIHAQGSSYTEKELISLSNIVDKLKQHITQQKTTIKKQLIQQRQQRKGISAYKHVGGKEET